MTYNSDNYEQQGGSRWVVGGSLDIESGGDLDIESGATWKIAGTAVTATAEQLNSIDSVMEVANKSGIPMVAGALGYVSGYDTTLDVPIVSLADADDAAKKANLVLTEDIADNASGSAEAVATITGLNTDSYSAVGSLVYESTTEGESTQTAPVDADDDRRVVGVIKVKSATVGEIYYFPGKAGLELANVYMNNITPGTAKASGALIVDASIDVSGINDLGATNVDAGLSGTAGSVDVFPTTVSSGKLSLTCIDQVGDTTVTHQTDAMGQATVVHTADVGLADAYIAQSTAALTAAEVDVLDAVTPGTAASSKAVVLGSSGEIATITTATITTGNIETVNATDIDAGASGTAGSVDVFPSTVTQGKFSLACTDQTGDTTVTLNANVMGQATVVNIPDPGASASYVAQSTAALSLAEVDVLDAVTPGTAAASKALVLDGSLDIATINSATTTTLITTNLTQQSETINPVIYVEMTIGQGDVASAASKTIKASSGAIQYKIREIWLSGEGTNFSGGGGDRDLSIQDSSGTITYTVIDSAVLQSLAQGRWDSTEVPAPGTAADFLAATTAGEALVAKYSGGSADYSAGSLTILIALEKVA